MKLRKRFDSPANVTNEPVVQAQEVHLNLQQGEQVVVEESPPPFQPRRAKHARKKRLTMYNVFAILLLIVVVAGISTGLIKREQTQTTAPSQESVAMQETVPDEKTVVQVLEPQSIKPQPQRVEPVVIQPQQPTVISTKEVQKPVTQQVMKHKVKPGETLYRISIRYYHTGKYASYLTKVNGLRSPSDLVSGTTIKVPYPPN